MTRRHAADLRALRETGEAMRAQMNLPQGRQEMKTVERKFYVSFDNKEFDTAADCRHYERESSPARLVGLTEEQVEAALDRTDAELAEAIEECGKRITAKRLADGDRKRNRKAKGDEANGQTETQAPDLDAAPPPERQEAFA